MRSGPCRPLCSTSSPARQTIMKPSPIMNRESFDDDKPREACGLFGAFGHPDAAKLCYFGIYALQHRGQESAGMAVSDGEMVTVVKDMGLVSNVFDDRTLATLQGHLAIGHTRYSTTGGSGLRNAQPQVIETIDGPLLPFCFSLYDHMLTLRFHFQLDNLSINTRRISSIVCGSPGIV